MKAIALIVACLFVSTQGLAQGADSRHPLPEIVFLCSRGGIDEICAINPSTTEVRQLTNGGDPKAAPRWSRDRTRIAFHQRSGDRNDVFTMNADGSDVRKVTAADDKTDYRNPAWSPDGARLAMECGKGRVWDICVATLGQTIRMQNLTRSEPGSSSENPDWSSDGRTIAFQSNRDARSTEGARPFRGYDVYTMNADGGDVQRVTNTPTGRSTQNPAWSPDGRQLAVYSTRDLAEGALYILSADAGWSSQQVTRDNTRFGYGHPRWAPDGRSFVFHSNRDGTQATAAEVELYVIGIDGRGLRRITRNTEYDGFADW